MNAIKWMKWMSIGLLTMGLAVAMSACDDDDDDDGDGGTPGATNAPAAPSTPTTPTPTNAPADDSPADDPLPVFEVIAPQLLSPADGSSLFVPSEVQNEITFSWTAVPGATYYMLQLDESRKDTGDTSTTMTAVGLGQHSWKVWGMNNESANPMPTSATFHFTLRKAFTM